MARKIRWGVLSTANIAVKKVIPGMQTCQHAEVVAIASRDLGKAREAAKTLGIATAYGSYEQLLADPVIDAIYIPLPNHLHVPWTIKAAEAGKHVLCEKPIGMTAAEAETLIAVRERTGVKIAEAFMDRVARRDPKNHDHKMTVAELQKLPDANPPNTTRVEINVPNPSQTLDRIRTFQGVQEATIFGHAIHALVQKDHLDALRHEFAEATINAIEPSLEDVFVTLTYKIMAETN